MTKELYSTKDVREVREKLLEEQNGKDLLTGLPISSKDAGLDHDHDSQYVRGVLHRQTNAVLGKIENMWTRYLGWWYNGTLPLFLRKAADYLERKEDTRYVHPAWIKKMSVRFVKLNAADQTEMLNRMLDFINDDSDVGTNGKERRYQYEQLLKSKQFTYATVKGLFR